MTNESLEAHKMALITMYKSSLGAMAKELIGLKDITKQTHKDMIKALESPKPKKLLVMPRGTFKTSISSVAYPIWLLLSRPDLRILLDSEIYTNSKNRLREIKSHLESDRMVSYFGEFKTRVWNESEIIIKQRTKILKEASITCSGIGAGKTGAHYDVIIADDLNSPMNSNSPEMCEKVRTHYRYYTSLLDPGGILVVVGTRYSAGDVIQLIIDNELDEDQKSLIKA